jgi:hypothetical protein
MNQPTEFSLKQAVVTLEQKASPDGLFVEDIVATFGARSHGLLVLFFTVPFLQPIPLLGLSTPLGLIMMVLGVLLALGKKPWLPKKLMRKHLKASLILSGCSLLIKLLNKSEKFIRPRLSYFTAMNSVRALNGSLVAIYSLLLALPLPIPFSNAVPAWFLVTNAIGWLEKDGVVLLVSYLMAIGGFIFFAGIGAGSAEIINWMNLSRFF